MRPTDLPPALRELTVRRPDPVRDAEPVTDLINAVDQHDYGSWDMTVDDVREEWRGLDPELDAWLVTDQEDRRVAVATIEVHGDVQLRGYIAVHPELRHRGLGTYLLGRLEERGAQLVSRAPEGAQVTLVGWVKGGSRPELEWAARHGYAVSRRFLRMRIDMTEPPTTPQWPDGITVRRFRPGEDERRTFEAVQDAFADHWGFVPTPFEEWLPRTEREDFDPSLWFLAVADGEIAGTSLCNVMPESGWVGSLSVRRQWRRRGLARALLLHSFGEFWRRGQPVVALGVDADSLTGATRLYESAGMRVAEQYDQVRKVLRPGVDMEVRALDG